MADNKTYAVFQTNRGDFTVELFADKAPITVENFVNLANPVFMMARFPSYHCRFHDPRRRPDGYGLRRLEADDP